MKVQLNRLTAVLLLAACTIGNTYAQSAREVLDRAAAHITKGSGVKASFKATQFSGTTENSSTQGTMWMRGRKFKMQTPDMSTWFDGKTEWTMLKGSNEVNVSEPTESEQQAINPYALISIYKKGYALSQKKGELRGRPTYVVTMRAKRGQAIAYVIVDVDSSTFKPLCIRALRDGDWTRLSILSLTTDNVPDATFTFPKSEYPNAEVIDLR